MRKIFLLSLSLLLIMALAGCARIRSKNTGDTTEPKKARVDKAEKKSNTSAADIEIFWGDEKPSRPYKAIGQVSTYRFNKFTGFSISDDKVYETLKRMAAKKGGNAIISIREDFASKSGTVIVFKDTQPDTETKPTKPAGPTE